MKRYRLQVFSPALNMHVDTNESGSRTEHDATMVQLCMQRLLMDTQDSIKVFLEKYEDLDPFYLDYFTEQLECGVTTVSRALYFRQDFRIMELYRSIKRLNK